jgi:MATE family multidrug resistance protein
MEGAAVALLADEAGESVAVTTAPAGAESKAGAGNDDGEEGEGEDEEDEDEDEGAGPGGSRSCWGPVLRFLASGRRWRTFLQQCLPNLGTSALSTLQWTTISFLAAGIGALQIAAHNGAMALNEVVHALTNGMAEATSIRVGFHLGRGDAVGAQRAAALGLGMAALLGATVAVPGFFARAYLGRIFSDDPAVVSAVESIATWFRISNYLECVCATAWAVLEGQGRASANTYVAFFCDWCVGMVLAVLSTRFTSYGLSGLWGGVAIGSAVALVAAVALILASDWPRLVEDARARLEEEEREDKEAADKRRRARAGQRAREASAGEANSAPKPLLGE